MAKFNLKSVSLSYHEYFSLLHIVRSVCDTLVMDDNDGYSCYFNDESLIAILKDDYNIIKDLLS